MGSFSLFHWIIVGVVVLLLFGGRGKISSIMGDLAKGIKSFKKGMAEEDAPNAENAPPQVPPPASASGSQSAHAAEARPRA